MLGDIAVYCGCILTSNPPVHAGSYTGIGGIQRVYLHDFLSGKGAIREVCPQSKLQHRSTR